MLQLLLGFQSLLEVRVDPVHPGPRPLQADPSLPLDPVDPDFLVALLDPLRPEFLMDHCFLDCQEDQLLLVVLSLPDYQAILSVQPLQLIQADQ